MAEPTRRLFFALWPDAVLKAQIGHAARTPARSVDGRRVRDENLHLTLLFLGNVGADAEARVRIAAGASCQSGFSRSRSESFHIGSVRSG